MEKKSNAIFLDEKKLKNFIKNEIDIDEIKNRNWIIDGIDDLIEKYDEKVLNLVNIILSTKNSFILVTSKNPPKFLNKN